MTKIRFNINMGGGIINHIVAKKDKVYRFVEDGVMIYNYNNEDFDTLITMISDEEYNDNFIATIEYNLDIFENIDSINIEILIEEYNKYLL